MYSLQSLVMWSMLKYLQLRRTFSLEVKSQSPQRILVKTIERTMWITSAIFSRLVKRVLSVAIFFKSSQCALRPWMCRHNRWRFVCRTSLHAVVVYVSYFLWRQRDRENRHWNAEKLTILNGIISDVVKDLTWIEGKDKALWIGRWGQGKDFPRGQQHMGLGYSE